ncbi:MAG: (4Fe-4S)-binding protein [Nitrospirae bacterium CG_4_9_14_3_um_filter_41_27]|nr:(4Fe-4S)-binding protein [Nitrospirota bacterium]PIQ94013.1 MAG: (4Fe-4S)-binding protein [Nitrospirae bacterium CG11_big_fil_rev_8_21_14_0_20_41_14]PIV42702.1 MAG: (4Fe-4S)-binding protein [Nitrospirae bacterium CG02_land_8_20_14_3_00_41_53]PIW86396.1 MAG: (4Fe-4S)-binding protein [Nitrospirae bacterium CG_4_8_14_3_um_filter_41_47]PJA80173.1 MAG: (4Fe-4S)-binding protein [Nitrospirae bacterium CG_4_9_14_3_um_filter_41_27]
MKQIVVISGKGGTGKTVLTASFASLAMNKVMVDCDVDAADLHLLVRPEIKERHEFRSGVTARIDRDICQECGKCISVCRFDAISEDFRVDAVSCEGCTICSYVCPAGAVVLEENVSGEWFVSETKYGPFVHAKLGIAEENSGKLVSKVREAAKAIAEQEKLDYVIIDGPPGIGCPVIASLSGVDLALIVTEPTLSGMHDMERVEKVSKHFSIPTKVVINKYDLNPGNSEAIKQICQKADIDVIALLPFSRQVSESIVQGIPLVEFTGDGIAGDIAMLWERIK